MLAEKKTLPLWRRRRTNLLAMERALSSSGRKTQHSDSEHAVIGLKAAARRARQARGRVRTPA